MKVKVGAEQRKTFCFSLLDSINRAGGTENRGREGRKVDKKYISPVRGLHLLGKKVTFLSELVGFNYKFLDVIRKVFDLAKLVMTF